MDNLIREMNNNRLLKNFTINEKGEVIIDKNSEYAQYNSIFYHKGHAFSLQRLLLLLFRV